MKSHQHHVQTKNGPRIPTASQQVTDRPQN